MGSESSEAFVEQQKFSLQGLQPKLHSLQRPASQDLVKMSGNPSGPPFRGIQQGNVRHDDSSTLMDGNELWTTPINNISPYEAYNRDNQRILAYRNAIMRLHEKYMKGKIVLDMSKKNGTYAGFALRAGAAKCYVVEGSLKEADHTRSILELNGYDTRCVVKQCEIKDLTIDEEHVDVILHESMGECLFVMSGIKDVIEARDKFLRPKHGLILPNEATLHLVGINNEDLRQISIDFWCRPIEGLSLEGLREVALSEPEMAYIQPEMVVTKETFLQRFNLYNVSLRHLCVDVPFFVETQKSCNITAFVAFFKVDFGQWNDPAETKTKEVVGLFVAVKEEEKKEEKKEEVVEAAPEEEGDDAKKKKKKKKKAAK